MAASATVATAAVMAASATVATSTTVTVAAAAVTAMTTMADEFYHRGCPITFLVEDVEGRQADVRDFFFVESDLIVLFAYWRGQV
jgi:hypothetical protein